MPRKLKSAALQPSVVQNQLTSLVDAAPEALDTLNELAAALGDDANFASTVTNALATKAPLQEPTFTGQYIKLPSGTTAQRPSSPTGDMIRKNTTTGYVEYYDPSTSSWIGIGEFRAIGGTITTAGGYTYHTFTSSGTFQVLSGVKSVEYLIVAGGGGAGSSNGAAGAGAGGLLNGSTTATPNYYTITVGAGGANTGGSNTIKGYNGNDSYALGLTAIGGGGSGSEDGGNMSVIKNGANGGSGGGGVRTNNIVGLGGSGTPGQGNAGGRNINDGSPYYCGGGGGGAGAAGSNGSGTVLANGGDGRQFSAWATATSTGANTGYYAGGGAGGGYSVEAPNTGGTPGLGGGGQGGSGKTQSQLSGVANTGGGGGGHGNYYVASGSGGSGIVIIRYLS